MHPAIYDDLLGYGFRRSGRMIYAPRCERCRQCVAVRIPVEDFALRRNHKRVLRMNQDVVIHQRAAGFYDDHFALYQTYTRVRHKDGDMASASPEEYTGFLYADWCPTTLLEFRLEGRLVAAAVTDLPGRSVSAVYTYFNPALGARSLGTLAILQQIQWARELGLPHLYLGYWIRDSRKMAYKGRYRPIEAWLDGRWRRFEIGEPLSDPEAL